LRYRSLTVHTAHS